MQWPWQIPCAISPPPSWVSYPLSVCYGLSVLILVWLLSFNPHAVLVAGQNLLGRCCSPMNQSSVKMVTTYDNFLSFQCLGSIFWWQTKCWMNTPSSGSPPPCNVSPHWACQYATPSIFPATVALWTLAFQNCLCLPMGFGWTVAVYRSHYLTHILVLAKYVKLPLWTMVLTLSSLLFFQLFFPCKASGGGIHGGQIQPVTTHLRVNIREFILSIKQYCGHL